MLKVLNYGFMDIFSDKSFSVSEPNDLYFFFLAIHRILFKKISRYNALAKRSKALSKYFIYPVLSFIVQWTFSLTANIYDHETLWLITNETNDRRNIFILLICYCIMLLYLIKHLGFTLLPRLLFTFQQTLFDVLIYVYFYWFDTKIL